MAELNSKHGGSHRDLKLEYVSLETLTLDPENARQHKPAQVKQIAASIKAFAFNAPVLIDGAGKVLAGHGRVMACEKLGWTQIPAIRLDHLSPAEARAYAIADNRLTEKSTWDEAMLAGHFKVLAALDLDFSIETTGFSIGEIDLKIEGLDGPANDDDPDDVAPPAGPSIAQFGDLWILGKHKLLCGDALESSSYETLLGEERAAMVFTDPPYNVKIDGNITGKGKVHHRDFAMGAGEMSEPEFIAFLTKACGLMAEFSNDGSVHYVCMDWGHLYALITAGRTAYDGMLNICVWAKPYGGLGGIYRSAHEMVVVFKHGRAAHRNNVKMGRYGRNRTNVWNYAGSRGFGRGEDADLTSQHPTPKPVQMIADAILDVTARGDVVLDPFLGSGSTVIACQRVGRCCRGIEMDPLYVDLSIRRWQRLTGDDAVRQDGANFNDLIPQPEKEAA